MPENARTLRLPRELRIFTLLQVSLWLLCVACETYYHVRKETRVFFQFPFIPFQHFTDLLTFSTRFRHFHSPDFFNTAASYGSYWSYPAPLALVYALVYSVKLPGHPAALFLALTLLLLAVVLSLLGRAMHHRGLRIATTAAFLLSAILLSYPFWFEYLLGNMELVVFWCVAFGVVAYLRDRPYTAAAFFGIAASMKIYPFVYLGLLFARGRYRQFGFGVAILALVTLVSMWAICPDLGVTTHGILRGLSGFKSDYLVQHLWINTGFDHSFFAFFKRSATVVEGALPDHHLRNYLAGSAVLGLAIFFLVIRRLAPLNQVLALSIAAILLPPTSMDYTLLHLYAPFAFLLLLSLRAAHAGTSVRGLIPAFVCFAILFAPETEFIHKYLSYGGQIKAITLVILFVITASNPFTLEPTSVREVAQAELSRTRFAPV